MIFGIFFSITSQIILVPIVLNVHKTNNNVLILFGYIEDKQIDSLIELC